MRIYLKVFLSVDLVIDLQWPNLHKIEQAVEMCMIFTVAKNSNYL